jgi:anti-anti-sigma regulatory factor
VIDASAITQIDTTAAAMLLDIRTRLRRRGIVMVLAEVQSSVAAFLGRAGLSPQEGDLQFFDDLDDAFHAFEATASMPREGQA